MLFGYPNNSTEVRNLDWIITKVQDFQNRLDAIQTAWIKEAKDYTDEQVSQFRSEIDQFEIDFNNFRSEVNQNQAAFEQEVDNEITNLQFSFEQFKSRVEDEVQASYEYVNQAIDFNNAYLINEMGKVLRQLTVINYFTGLPTSVQDMFDYLCRFHLTNAISYTQLQSRGKTYTELANLNMTYTDLALNGGSLIV